MNILAECPFVQSRNQNGLHTYFSYPLGPHPLLTLQITSGVTTSTSDSAYTSILSLSSLALSDAGAYTCTATYSHSDGSNAVSLVGTIDVTVRGFETDPADANVNQGSQVVISCVVVGDQQATITW